MAGIAGLFGMFVILIYVLVFAGLVVLGWNAYIALRIYIKKNSDVLEKAGE